MPIKVFQDVASFRNWREGVNGAVSFVPTMGALHQGHVSLCHRGRELAPTVVASIYVNPLQFGPQEDFANYPRTFAEDVKQLDRAGVAAVLAPKELGEAHAEVKVVAGSLARELCGAKRPGHFDGVLTVLTKLFNIIKPSVAVFGEKDYQQCAVVAQWCRDTYQSCTLDIHTIVRESTGLAMSSRNRRLSPSGLKTASALYQSLQETRRDFLAGETEIPALEACARRALEGLDIEYCEIRDPVNLSRVALAGPTERLFMAARVEGVRLIDNGALGNLTPVLG
ncbi:MAG: pantoate--beta-alanine ligase [Planctomycetota bacterium]